jgi:hypothetical protein
MEDNANKNNISQQKNDPARSPEPLQVPPSLLPTVLHRLGLTPEQAQQELSVEEVLVKLKSSGWEERARAVRLLGKLATAPIELLEAALDDEDSAVRAAAVHAMGNIGQRAPLHRLVQALHDANWHVRETAVFALGKQGPRVPDEVFKVALYDTDHSVREAARYTLQWHVSRAETSAVYGQLQEKKDMQQDHNAIQINSRNGQSPYETEPYMVLREQAQAYAPQEQIYHEYGTDMPSGEKVTSYSVRRSSKKWWIIIPIVALCFFLLGALSVGLFSVKSSSQVAVAQSALGRSQVSTGTVLMLFGEAQYQSLLEQEVSNGLKLTPQQIMTQLQTGKSMADIATAQGISTDQLRKIETGAFTDTLLAMVNAGDVSQAEANAWQARNLRNPEQVDTWTSVIFTLPTSVPAPGSN